MTRRCISSKPIKTEGGARMIRAFDLQPDGTVRNMRVHYNFYPRTKC